MQNCHFDIFCSEATTTRLRNGALPSIAGQSMAKLSVFRIIQSCCKLRRLAGDFELVVEDSLLVNLATTSGLSDLN